MNFFTTFLLNSKYKDALYSRQVFFINIDIYLNKLRIVCMYINVRVYLCIAHFIKPYRDPALVN